jgi:hypothetical protein
LTSHDRWKTLKAGVIGMSNARPYKAKRSPECLDATQAWQFLHMIDSPDFVPSDVILLGQITARLTDCDGTPRKT